MATDPFSLAAGSMAKEAAASNVYAIQTAPEAAARANRVGRELGIPPALVDLDLPDMEARAQTTRARTIMGKYPVIASWSADPRNAAVGRDDMDGLGKVAKTLSSYLGSTALTDNRSLLGKARDIGARSLIRGGQNVVDAISNYVDLQEEYDITAGLQRKLFGGTIYDPAQRGLRGYSSFQQQGIDARAEVKTGNWYGDQAVQGLESVAPNIASLAMAAITRNPTLPLLNIGIQTQGSSYRQGRDAGLSVTRATAFAIPQTVFELAGESLPIVKYIEDLNVGSSFFKTLGKQVVAENIGEQFTGHLQDFNEWVTLNPEKTFGEFAAERPEAALGIAVATTAAAGLQTGTVETVRRTAGRVGNALEARARLKEAEATGQFLDRLSTAVTDGKVGKRDGAALSNFIAMQTDGTPSENIFIPGEKVAEFFQSMDMDWHDPDSSWDFADDFSGQVDRAIATGGDVVVKTADFAAHMAGTPAWDALKDHVRLSPGGMSVVEARTYEADEDANLEKLGEMFAADMERDRAAMEPRDKLYQSVRDKLVTQGFTQSAASTNAELITARYASRAARLGLDLKGDEFDATEVRQVLPPGLAPVVAADQLDVAIDVLKRARDPKKADRGASLLDWIARQGGVEDRGGDIKSMGGDKWHVGKPGMRKLIRAHDDTGSFLPGQKNANTPDDLAMRAWEAGYFPEFSERPDVNTLLESIGEGIAGRDRFAREATGANEAMRAAVGDLEALLDQQGLDPDKASKAEIRKAVERYQAEQAAGQGYDQAATADGWRLIVDKLLRKDPLPQKITISSAPGYFGKMGLNSGSVVMSSGKLGRSRSKHKLTAENLYDLPALIAEPLAAFPSARDDGSVIIVTVGRNRNNHPIVIPVLAENDGTNVVLSVVAKEPTETRTGDQWVADAIAYAQKNGQNLVLGKGFADAKPQPSEESSDSPSDLISAGGPTKPGRKILSIKAAVKKQFDQSFADGPRGRITFNEGKSAIDLFAARDASTFIHETGHLWLEELRTDATDENAPDALKADWQVVQDWFAANGHPIVDGVIPVDAHELWARGWERYALEGKSPSSALRKVFDAFRSWLLQIYKVVDNLRAPITPEIREVMDRLIATDEEIEQARETQNIKALFTDAAQAGMSEQEFAAYQATTTEARDEAFDALLYRTMQAIRDQRKKAWQDEEATVRAEVAERVDRRPEFRALAALRAKQPRLKLDKAWLADIYGEDALKLLPGAVPPIYAEKDTTHADVIAEMNGFRTGDEMVRMLMGIGQRTRELREGGDQRSVRKVLIDEETAAVMRERHGDPLTDGSIEEEALAAIHNEKQGEIIASELRALSRRSPNRPTPYKIAREWAARTIAESRVVDSTSGSAIQRYAKAAAKAAKAAEAAMLKGDVDETFRQKQAQMLNNALIAEAKKAKDAVDAAVVRLGKLAKRATIKSIEQDYLDQVHQLLEQVEFPTVSQTALDERESYEAWATAQQAAGFDIVNPPSFAAQLGKRNWSRLSVEELLGLDETVKQIVHLGRHKQKLLDAKEERDFKAVVDEAVAAAGLLPPKPPSDTLDPLFADRLKHGVALFDSALLKIETLIDWLDSGRADGVFNRIVFQPIAEAQERAGDLFADYVGRVNAAMAAVPVATLRRWQERVTIPELLNRETGNPFTLSRQQLVSMALNMGNEGNAQRLSDGYGWIEDQVLAVLNRELTAEEWTYVQSVWDIIDGLWPRIEAMERRLNGVAPERVAARPVETSAGTLRGGYFPAVYDSTRDYRSEQYAAQDRDLFATTYTKANTRASATKDRAEKVKRPILLDLGVITRHLGETIHDITHREAIMNADKFLSARRVMKAIDSTLGPEARGQFRPWLKFVANQWAIERAGNEGVGKFINNLRTNTTVVGMGFRISTIMLQIGGYSNSFEAVGAKWVAAAVAQTSRHPVETFNFVMAKSGEIRHRMDTLDRDIAQAARRLAGRTNPLTQAKRFAFHGIGYMDRIVVIPTWIGAYNKELAAGQSEEQAIYAADKAVRQSQGAGAAKDMAAVVRGQGQWGQALKLMTMFYSYLSAVYQRQRTLGRDVRRARVDDVPGLMARAWWLLVVPPLLSELMAGRGPEDDEEWGWWAFKNMLFQSLGAIPLVRDIGKPAWDKLTGAKGFDYQLSPLQNVGQSVVKVAGDVGRVARGEDTKRATRDTLEAAGYWTGIVPGQIAAATQFLVDVGYGEQDPESVSDWWEGITKGKIEED